MALMSTSGLSEIIRDLNASAEDLKACSEEICDTGAEIIKDAQNSTGLAMGVHRTGVTLGSLKICNFVRTAGGGYKKIIFDGNNEDGNPNSEVAFINEYGKTNQPGRPFVSTANETSEPATIRAAIDVLDRHLKKHNL